MTLQLFFKIKIKLKSWPEFIIVNRLGTIDNIVPYYPERETGKLIFGSESHTDTIVS